MAKRQGRSNLFSKNIDGSRDWNFKATNEVGSWSIEGSVFTKYEFEKALRTVSRPLEDQPYKEEPKA